MGFKVVTQETMPRFVMLNFFEFIIHGVHHLFRFKYFILDFFQIHLRFMIYANIWVLGQLCTLQLCTPKFYINFKIQGIWVVISKDSNWYKSIQTSSHLFIYKVQEVQRKSLNILFRVTSMLRQFLWVIQIVTFASIDSNSIKNSK